MFDDNLPHGSPVWSVTKLMCKQQWILKIVFFVVGDLSPNSSALTNSPSSQIYINHWGRVEAAVGTQTPLRGSS